MKKLEGTKNDNNRHKNLKVSAILKLTPQSFKVVCDLSSPIDTIMKITEYYSYTLSSQDCAEQDTILLFVKNLNICN